jgi:hypothetical protein
MKTDGIEYDLQDEITQVFVAAGPVVELGALEVQDKIEEKLGIRLPPSGVVNSALSTLTKQGILLPGREKKTRLGTVAGTWLWEGNLNPTPIVKDPYHKTRSQVAKITDDLLHKAVNELALVDSLVDSGKALTENQHYDLHCLIDQIYHQLGVKSNISGNYPHEGE